MNKQDFVTGVPFWTAMCACKEHKNAGFHRVSKEDAWNIAIEIGADVFTEQGAKKIGHEIISRKLAA